ncbi:MAG: FecCD family ABC transporter permease [Oscillospiraceae bacterium]
MKSSRTSSIRKGSKKKYFFILAALVVLAAAASMCFGTVFISPLKLLRVFSGKETGTSISRIVLYIRLPRTCGCLLAGTALAVSGTIIQSVLSNPLAAPNIIGVNSGAGLCVAICCAIAPSALNLVPVMAFIGAFAAVVLVLVISEKTGASKITLVLAGVAVSSVLSAAIDAVVTLFPDALVGYSDFRIGSLSNLTMSRIGPAFWIILVCLIIAFSMTNEIDVMMLGTDTARSLGLHTKRMRLLLLALAAALAGAAVSFSGLIGFIGLIVPHIMRRLMGEESRFLLPASALGGAALLTICDLLARSLFSPFELPVGIVMSFVGGPFFIWLLLHQRGGRIHD